MTTIINANTSAGLTQTADTSGIVKLQSNGVTTNALAWVNFAGASGTRNANYNVSSVTRSSTGQYRVAFTTAMTDANYVVCGAHTAIGGDVSCFMSGSASYAGGVNTTASCGVNTSVFGGNTDPTSVFVAVFGN